MEHVNLMLDQIISKYGNMQRLERISLAVSPSRRVPLEDF